MSEQAEIQEDDEAELEVEELDAELETDESEVTESDDEVEIVFEGEEQPASVPLTSHLARVKKLTGRVSAAKEETTEKDHTIEMLKAENDLLQTKMNQGKQTIRPKAEDFDTDEAYDVALDKWYEAKIDAKVDERTATQATTQQTQVTQTQNDQKLETKLNEHYQRADTLKVPDYTETEDRAIELLGNDVAKHIMASFPKSHELLYHFGKEANAAKAAYFKDRLANDPVGGLLELGGYAKSLKAKPKRSTAPDPETKVEGGVGKINKDDLHFAKGAKFY